MKGAESRMMIMGVHDTKLMEDEHGVKAGSAEEVSRR